ncbi:MAG: dihydroorotate dehydrogenase [Bacteroidota bacterium]|jgi:dihydroorotate dehydrogenase (NAD+) catalytic subunit|nr:dihydroorotate dehydrogenase [Bacteroidota bacterium]OQC45799.1 MAG: Dihydroorotate dehydrogenase B (NAD(+)), catalytic subunit [Bacteroidetes bacterium ADurb.Bin028]HNY45289.1 dihydroorotate dehydrogenase [Bacteroidales bacterium]
MVNLEINFAGLKFKNPILTASGTFGYGTEFADFIDLNLLGGFIVKGTTLNHREGNPYPRMAETASGMLNAVGLQNKGVKYFCENIYPEIKDLKTNIFVNVSGSTIEDYVATAEMINNLENIPGIELNISCPNVKEGGMAFGTSCTSAAQVVKEVRKVYKKHLMVKLSPNVTDIVSIAQTVESEGANSISLVNTFLGMAIDAKTRTPKLSTITGGLSGPAIKPIALRMVWQVSKAVKIPICGLGGIMNAEDVIEFMLAGASCVQIGTANFIDPDITIKIINDLQVFCENQKIKNIDEIIGGLRL